MKKFTKVVIDGGGYGAPASVLRKPVFRSSAIFPMIRSSSMSSRILFMGYWILKREIKEVGVLYTLRSKDGGIIVRKLNTINSPKSQIVELAEMLPSDYDQPDFFGSLELEVFSTQDMVFPYPAFVLEYYGRDFSTCVHTTGRVYNDFEDFKDTADFDVAESGFDIYGCDGMDPFFAFANGPLPNSGAVKLEVINSKNESQWVEVYDIAAKAYETKIIHLRHYFSNLKTFLGQNPGTAKIRHDFKGFFPRFLAGNFDNLNQTASITHTYYDCSLLNHEDAYWKRQSEDLYDSSIFVPVFLNENKKTKLKIYPMYSPSRFSIGISILGRDGTKLDSIPDFKQVSGCGEYFELDIGEVAVSRKIPLDKIGAVFLTQTWQDASRIPSRLKFGLNVLNASKTGALPCNICFGPELGITKTLQKTGTRKWAPILQSGESVVVIVNSTTKKEYNTSANISYKIFRAQDDFYIEREYCIPPLGQIRISASMDEEIRDFLGSKAGWIYIDSDNPFVNAWYFVFGPSGVVGADHSF